MDLGLMRRYPYKVRAPASIHKTRVASQYSKSAQQVLLMKERGFNRHRTLASGKRDVYDCRGDCTDWTNFSK